MHALRHQPDRLAGGCGRASLPLALWILGIVTLAGMRPAAAQEPTHPLDALTAPEYGIVHDVLRQSGRLDAASTFAGVWLEQPPKSEVLAWRPGEPFRREAQVVIRQGLRAYRALVDIGNARLASWMPIEGAQANLSQADFDVDIDGLVRSDDRVRAALARRGITDLATIECTGVAPWYIGEQVSGRLIRADCRDRHGGFDPHGRTIGGLVILVDIEGKQVLRVVDDEITPVPRGADLDPALLGVGREVPSPIVFHQPQGPGFKVDGSQVSWQTWRFHLRVDPRVGAVISNVAYDDEGRLRRVLYQGHLSEIFVPYMDPTSTWYFASYLDVGARSVDFPKPLERGTDCPDHAVFVDGLNTNHRGFPHRIPRAACLFEREAGDVAWRHRTDDRNVESRARRDLVLRVIGTIGNYDYLIDWVFMQDGAIKVVAGATGMVVTKPVVNRTVTNGAAPPADGDGDRRAAGRANLPPPAADAYGRFIDENTVAINHDIFCPFVSTSTWTERPTGSSWIAS